VHPTLGAQPVSGRVDPDSCYGQAELEWSYIDDGENGPLWQARIDEQRAREQERTDQLAEAERVREQLRAEIAAERAELPCFCECPRHGRAVCAERGGFFGA
jgi:hypothetical protein